MIISCIAHAMFLIELDSGLRIVTDPVGEDSGYPVEPVKADVVLISHRHHDHSCMASVKGWSRVIDTACERVPVGNAEFTAIKGWHDDAEGAKRGETLLFLMEAEGLRIAHAGDLGILPDEAQIRKLAPLDILMIPVGGYYTINAEQAKKASELLQARTVLPMHYRTEQTADWPIAGPEDFMKLYSDKDADEQPMMRVTMEDLPCQPRVCLLKPQLRG